MSQHRDPKNTSHLLILACLLQFGNYYAYDTPASINTQLRSYLSFEYDTWQFILNGFFVAYSLPNIILPFAGGKMIDTMGSRNILMMCATVNLFGQVVFSAAVLGGSVWGMLFGRFLFGVGGETGIVAQATLMSEIFGGGDDLLFAMCLNLCVSKAGSVCNAIVSPPLVQYIGVEATLFAATIATFLSTGACFLLYVMTKDLHSARATCEIVITSVAITSESTPLLSSTQQQQLAYIEPLSVHQAIAAPRAKFPFSFWMTCVMYITFSGPFVGFYNTSSDFLMSKWYPKDPVSAGFAMSIPTILNSVLIPVLGYMLSTNAYSSFLLIISFTAMFVVHVVLGYTMINPLAPLFVMGVSAAINGALIYPFVNLVIRREETRLARLYPASSKDFNMLGAAYGVCTCGINASLALFPLCAAWIVVGSGGGWPLLEAFYATWTAIGLICTIALYRTLSIN